MSDKKRQAESHARPSMKTNIHPFFQNARARAHDTKKAIDPSSNHVGSATALQPHYDLGPLVGLANRIFNGHELLSLRQQYPRNLHYKRGYPDDVPHTYICLWTLPDATIASYFGYPTIPTRDEEGYQLYIKKRQALITLVEAILIRLLGSHYHKKFDFMAEDKHGFEKCKRGGEMSREFELYVGSACSLKLQQRAGSGSGLLSGLSNRIFNQHELLQYRQRHPAFHYKQGYSDDDPANPSPPHTYVCLWTLSEVQIAMHIGYDAVPVKGGPLYETYFKRRQSLIQLVEAIFIRLLGSHQYPELDNLAQLHGFDLCRLSHTPLNHATALEV